MSSLQLPIFNNTNKVTNAVTFSTIDTANIFVTASNSLVDNDLIGAVGTDDIIGGAGADTLANTQENTSNNFQRYQITQDSFNIGTVRGPDPLDSTYGENVLDSAEEFTISQLDGDSEVVKSFKFSLSPAIQSVVGGVQPPEVKPGILKRTSQNIKTFNLPGAIPAFQVLGLKPSTMQLVGLLVGGEEITEEGSLLGRQPITVARGRSVLYNLESRPQAHWYSEYVERTLVQQGRPIRIDIKNSKMVLQYTALIQDVRHFIVRSDRVYYALDVLLLDYPNLLVDEPPAPAPADATFATPVSQTTPGVVDPF